jgi:uncharacterized damage-inducible protein DinB
VNPSRWWALRQVLRHVATAERYYASWLDETLPDDPVARYREAHRRFTDQLRRVFAQPPKEREALYRGKDALTTVAEVVEELLAAEQTALGGPPAVV